MRTPRIARTAVVRLAVPYAALFAAGAMALVGFLDWTVSAYAVKDLRHEIASELDVLTRPFPTGDAREIARRVRLREQALGVRQFNYVVTDPAGRVLAGDLPAQAARIGRAKVSAPPSPIRKRAEAEPAAPILTLGARTADGGIVVVGESTDGLRELGRTMLTATLAAAALVTLLSVGVAMLIGQAFLRRIDRANAAVGRIMDGRLDERLPAIGVGDEFDLLAANVNAMLDRIQALMEGLRQTSSDIAHDLRTPLSRLRRRLESVLEDRQASGGERALAQDALAQVDEILAVFAALLRIAQVEGGVAREAFRPIDLSELIERIGQAYEPVAEDHGKRLRSRIEPGVAIAGDEELIAQLVSNLLENAFTHAPSPGEVDLAVSLEGPRALLAVADRGPGVPEDQRTKVVRRFYRLDRSRTAPGAGLGLAMAQAIAQLHGGRLELEDNHPGLLARVVLPRLAKDGP